MFISVFDSRAPTASVFSIAASPKGTGMLNLSRVMRKLVFEYAKRKAQISSAITAQLISAFDFAT